MQTDGRLDRIEEHRSPTVLVRTKRTQSVNLLRWLSMLLSTILVCQLVAGEPSPNLGKGELVIKTIKLTDPVYPGRTEEETRSRCMSGSSGIP